MKKDSFVFYKSFFEAIEMIPEENQLDVYKALCNYNFNKELPNEISGTAKALFTLMRPNIDSANKRYKASVENGKKGGAPKRNQNAKKETKNNPTTTKKQPNNNLNDNVDDNVNDNNKEIYKEKYFDNEGLNDLFIDFLKLRKSLKAKNTDRAITRLINILNEYDDDIKIEMLNNSIVNSWKSVYEVKDKNKGGTNYEYL